MNIKNIHNILPKRVIGVLIVTAISLVSYRVTSSTVDKTNYSENNEENKTQTTTIVKNTNEKNENTPIKSTKEKGKLQTDYYVKDGVYVTDAFKEKMEEVTKQLDLSPEQQINIIRAYRNGNNIIAEDGTNFGLTLASIIGRESSYGIKLFNTKVFHKKKTSLGAFQIHLETAREVIDEFEMNEGKNLSDTQLAYKLAHDFDFGAKIAGLYLKKNYEEAMTFHSNPWKGAVSKYNGGWYNHTYLTALQDNIKTVKAFIKIMNI